MVDSFEEMGVAPGCVCERLVHEFVIVELHNEIVVEAATGFVEYTTMF